MTTTLTIIAIIALLLTWPIILVIALYLLYALFAIGPWICFDMPDLVGKMIFKNKKAKRGTAK